MFRGEGQNRSHLARAVRHATTTKKMHMNITAFFGLMIKTQFYSERDIIFSVMRAQWFGNQKKI